jgi:hypothetical protein
MKPKAADTPKEQPKCTKTRGGTTMNKKEKECLIRHIRELEAATPVLEGYEDAYYDRHLGWVS